MKKVWVAGVSILYSLALSGAEMTFHASFDKEAGADFAKGQKELAGSKAEFADGVKGRGIVIGGTPETGHNIYEISPDKNFDIKKGAISFWIKPLDWKGSDLKIWNVFVNVDGNSDFLIYKFFNSDVMPFLYGTNQQWSRSMRHISDWETGKWHHIVATWDDGETALYVDGKLNQRTRNPEKYHFSAPRKLYLGPGWGKVSRGKSVLDEIKIFNAPISRTEVEKLFAEHAKSAGMEGKSKLVLGSKSVAVTGTPNAEQYAFAGTLFSGLNGEIARKQGQYFLSYDSNAFFFGWKPEENCKTVELALENQNKYLVKITGGNVQFFKDGKEISSRGMHLKNNELAIPFSLLGVASAPENATWKMNVIFRYDDLTASAAPVIGAIGEYDSGRFYHMTFRKDAPHLRIDPVWNFKDGTAKESFSVSGGGKTDKIDLWLSREHFSAEGWHMRKIPLWSNGRSTPHGTAGGKINNSSSDALTFRIMRNDKEELFRNDYYLNTLPSNRVFYIYTKLKEKELVAMLESGGKPGKVRIRFLDKDGKCLLENIQEIPEKRYYDVLTKLDFDKVLKPGDYKIRIDFLENGKYVGDFEQMYRVPGPNDATMRPFVSKYPGVVPAPWTPVQSTNDSAEVWGRRYQVGNGLFLSKIVSGNMELLNAPITLVLNGKEIPAPVHVKKISASKEFAEWEAIAEIPGLKLKNKMKIYFDGVCESYLTLEPAKTRMIHSLDLVIPVKRSIGRLVTDCSVLSWGKSGALPDQYESRIERGTMWIGTEKVGLSWSSVTKGIFPLKITTQGEESRVCITLLAKKNISKPETLEFGFVATPIKPQNNALRRNRIGKETQMWIQPYNYFFYPDHKEIDSSKVEQAVNGYKEGYLYGTLGRMYSPYAPETAYWNEVWKGKRPYGSMSLNPYVRPMSFRNNNNYLAGLQGEHFINFIMNQLQEFYEKGPVHPNVQNYYFDGVGNRHRVLEVHKMIKGKNPESKISFHTIPRNDMTDQFSDITIFGEGFENKVARDNGYYNILTPELFRAQLIGVHNGTRPVLLNQIVRSLDFEAKEKAASFDVNSPVWQKAFKHFFGYLTVHDADVWPTGNMKHQLPFLEKLWAAQDGLGWDEKTVFHPYWEENGPVKQLAPKSSRVMASAFTHSGKLLLAVLNDTDQEQSVKLTLDLKKMGVKSGLKGVDVWEPNLHSVLGNTFEDRIPPRGFRLILFQ